MTSSIFGPCPNIVDDHVATSLRGLLIDNDAYVRHSCTQIPCDNVPGREVFNATADGESPLLAPEEHHEIRHSTMIDVRIWTGQKHPPTTRIGRKILDHI